MITWKDIDKRVQEQLKDHKYNNVEAWKTIGCGEKVLRRYVDSGLITAIKTSDQWFFSQDQINKAIFINTLRKRKKWDSICFLAGLYDYLLEHNCPCSPEVILEYAKKYE